MSDNGDSDEELYSYTSSKTVYKKLSQPLSSSAVLKSEYSTRSDSDEQSYSEAQSSKIKGWAVDYNNKNYIRSLCNKNKGYHRRLKGRPEQFKIHYDNNFFTRSKVNDPKGLHRKKPDINKKYVPDKDELADAAGWEFDYGPEFDQVEEDIPYSLAEARIIRRGGYRWYGAHRNPFDHDLEIEDERENVLSEELKEKQKYGHEFLQSDIPHMEIQTDLYRLKDVRYKRGAYRFYEVLRNPYDFTYEDIDIAGVMHDPEYRRKHHINGLRYLDLEMCKNDPNFTVPEKLYLKKGKPFHHTVLNKLYKLRKIESKDQDVSVKSAERHGTRLSLVPGEGSQTFYEGRSDRLDKPSSIRSVYKKTESRYEKRDKEMRGFDRRSSRGFDEYAYKEKPKAESIRGSRASGEEMRGSDRREHRGFDEYTHKRKPEEKENLRKRYGRERSDEDAADIIETIKETTTYRKEQGKSGQHIVKKKSRELRKETSFTDRGYPPSDAVEKRRHKERHYDHDEDDFTQKRHHDHEDRRSQKPESISRDRHHGNQIQRPSEMRKVKEKEPRDYDEDDIYEREFIDRNKQRNGVDEYETETTLIKKIKKVRSVMNYDDGSQAREIKGRSKQREDEGEHEKMIKKVKGRDSREFDFKDSHAREVNGRTTRRGDVREFEAEITPGKHKKMPPHVEERVKNIREKMNRQMEQIDHTYKDHSGSRALDLHSSEEEIDLMKHKGHPNDRGEEHKSEYEKYTSKNGSEIWVKKNEEYAELHHKKT